MVAVRRGKSVLHQSKILCVPSTDVFCFAERMDDSSAVVHPESTTSFPTIWALPLCLLAAAATCPSTAHSPLRRGPLHTLRAPAPPKSPSLAPAQVSCCSRLSLRGGMAEEKPELLPANVVPRHYDLCITPDLKEFVFKGVVTIELDVVASTDTIELHGCHACACLDSSSPRNPGCAPSPLDALRTCTCGCSHLILALM